MTAPVRVTGYEILSPIKHNGKRLTLGRRISGKELDQDDAKALIDQGVIKATEWLEDVEDDRQQSNALNMPGDQELTKTSEGADNATIQQAHQRTSPKPPSPVPPLKKPPRHSSSKPYQTA